jgi:SAM-dependent methyltransferase
MDLASISEKTYDSLPNRPLVEAVVEARGEFDHRPSFSLLVDLGCGTGSNLDSLKEEGFRCIGVSLSLQEASVCFGKGHASVVTDLSKGLPFRDRSLSVVIASHVLEHLAEPWKLLRVLHRSMHPDGWLFVALPNAVFLEQRLRVLRGRWRYTEAGLLDYTHLRFYDLHSARQLLEDNGFQIVRERHTFWYPHAKLKRLPERPTRSIFEWVGRRLPNLLAYQFLFVTRPKPEIV